MGYRGASACRRFNSYLKGECSPPLVLVPVNPLPMATGWAALGRCGRVAHARRAGWHLVASRGSGGWGPGNAPCSTRSVVFAVLATALHRNPLRPWVKSARCEIRTGVSFFVSRRYHADTCGVRRGPAGTPPFRLSGQAISVHFILIPSVAAG